MIKLVKILILGICLFIIPTSLYAYSEKDVRYTDGIIKDINCSEGFCWGIPFQIEEGFIPEMFFGEEYLEFPENEFTELDKYVGEEIIIKYLYIEKEDGDDEYRLISIWSIEGEFILDIEELFYEFYLKTGRTGIEE